MKKVFVCPWDASLLENKLFDERFFSPPKGGGWFWTLIRDRCRERGIEINTADYYDGNPSGAIFVAMGKILLRFSKFDAYTKLAFETGISRRILFSTEPAVISPNMFVNFDQRNRLFTDVFYNCRLERTLFSSKVLGYLMLNRSIGRINYYYPPMMLNRPLMEQFLNNKRKFLVMINSNKFPVLPYKELFSCRIRAVNYFGKLDGFSLFGSGWDHNRLYPWYLNTKAIAKCYKGKFIGSKYDELCKYKFAIAFENASFDGYLTEKMFDCFFCGTIPIYYGAPDVEKYVPTNCFVDFRKFRSFKYLHEYLLSITEDEIVSYRERILNFLSSDKFYLFTKEHFSDTFLKLVEN